MRIYLLLLLSSLGLASQAQKLNAIARANVIHGIGEQSGKLKNAYGLGTGIEMAIKKTPLKFVVNLDAAINGSQREPYEFNYQGNYTKTHISFTSYLFQLTTGIRYMAFQGKTFSPYAGISGGVLNYHSITTIEDPDDPDGCHALENDLIASGFSAIGQLEAGLRFNPKTKSSKISYECGVGYVKGTKAEYARISNENLPGGREYWVEFQSPTSEVHEHSVGKIYKTMTNQLAFHFTAVIPIQ